MLVKQAVYHLSHVCTGRFGDRISLVQASLDVVPPIL
jgi:hypothetical protein